MSASVSNSPLTSDSSSRSATEDSRSMSRTGATSTSGQIESTSQNAPRNDESPGTDHHQASDTEYSTVANWKARLVKTLLAFGFYSGNLILNIIILMVVAERVPLDAPPLPDVSFDLLPYWAGAMQLVEFHMLFLNIVLAVLIGFHRNGYRIAQRYFVINGIIYFFRAICMSLTQLPAPHNRESCEHKMPPNISAWKFLEIIINRSLIYIPSLGSQWLSKHLYCGDYLFSGHTVNVVIGYCFLSSYLLPAEVKATSILWKLADYVIFMASILAVVFITIHRGHYLVDIVVAYYVSTRTFYIYHTICNHESLHYSAATGNFFTKFWWWPVFVFFEVDNPGRIATVNRFHNPCKLIRSILSGRNQRNQRQ